MPTHRPSEPRPKPRRRGPPRPTDSIPPSPRRAHRPMPGPVPRSAKRSKSCEIPSPVPPDQSFSPCARHPESAEGLVFSPANPPPKPQRHSVPPTDPPCQNLPPAGPPGPHVGRIEIAHASPCPCLRVPATPDTPPGLARESPPRPSPWIANPSPLPTGVANKPGPRADTCPGRSSRPAADRPASPGLTPRRFRVPAALKLHKPPPGCRC